MLKQKIIRCDEIDVKPIIITLGETAKIDITKVSAYNSIRMLNLIMSINSVNVSTDVLVEATDIVMDILHEQNIDLDEETLLRTYNQAQITAFISTVIGYTLKTYSPLESDNPFVKTLIGNVEQ